MQVNVDLNLLILHLTAHFATISLENSLEDAFCLKFKFAKFLPNSSRMSEKNANSEILRQEVLGSHNIRNWVNMTSPILQNGSYEIFGKSWT